MTCPCQSNEKQAPIRIKKVVTMVNYEGQLVSQDSIPQGSLFIRGTWYGSYESLPDELKAEYGQLFKQQ